MQNIWKLYLFVGCCEIRLSRRIAFYAMPRGLCCLQSFVKRTPCAASSVYGLVILRLAATLALDSFQSEFRQLAIIVRARISAASIVLA